MHSRRNKKKRGDAQFVHNPETDALAGRVREIAHRALNMLYLELDQVFEDQSTSQVICLDEMALCCIASCSLMYSASLVLAS